jgi:DNA-binding protein HU-beta
MTKSELAEKVSSQTGVDKATVLSVIDSANQLITTTVASGNSVFIRGFGSYFPKFRKSKIGQNIGKGTSVAIPETFVPAFKPYPEFKEAVSQLTERDIESF